MTTAVFYEVGSFDTPLQLQFNFVLELRFIPNAVVAGRARCQSLRTLIPQGSGAVFGKIRRPRARQGRTRLEQLKPEIRCQMTDAR
jgi:hypothetical protein